jgi:hypothetical protein
MIVFAALVIAVWTGANYCFPSWKAGLALRMDSCLRLPAQLQRDQEQAENLDKQRATVLYRIYQRHRVLGAVFEQRMTLLEAAGWFRDLCRDIPASQAAIFRRNFAGTTDDERYCRQVIQFLRAIVKSKPSLADWPDRLEKELRLQLDHGVLRLPTSIDTELGPDRDLPSSHGQHTMP